MNNRVTFPSVPSLVFRAAFAAYGLALICCTKPVIAQIHSAASPVFPAAAEAQREVERHLVAKAGPSLGFIPIPQGQDAERWKAAEKYQNTGLTKPKQYGMIAMDLKNARSLLTRSDGYARRNGLGMALETARVAFWNLRDYRLSALICDAYAIPYLGVAHPDPTNGMSKQDILPEIATRYFEAKEIAKFTECYRLLLECAPNRNTADAARMRIAQGLELQGNIREAIEYLEQIDPQDSMRGARERIPILKNKLKNDFSSSQ